MGHAAEAPSRNDPPRADRIRGIVEVDENYLGGVEEARGGGRRRDSSKSIVVAAVEVRGRGPGRIRLGVVPDVSGPSLVGFVEAAVAPGSTVRTDGWAGYVPLKQRGYDHRPTTQGAPKEAAALFPRVHRVFTHLKTWVWGTHRGVSKKHLPTTSTSSSSASTGAARRWRHSSRCSGSRVSIAPRPTVGCTMLSQPDR